MLNIKVRYGIITVAPLLLPRTPMAHTPIRKGGGWERCSDCTDCTGTFWNFHFYISKVQGF